MALSELCTVIGHCLCSADHLFFFPAEERSDLLRNLFSISAGIYLSKAEQDCDTPATTADLHPGRLGLGNHDQIPPSCNSEGHLSGSSNLNSLIG
jgi:hypothetical protein